MGMNIIKLDKIESEAISKAASQIASDILEVTLQKLWDLGVRDLSQMDQKLFTDAGKTLATSPEINGIAAKLLVLFSNEIRDVVAREKL